MFKISILFLFQGDFHEHFAKGIRAPVLGATLIHAL